MTPRPRQLPESTAQPVQPNGLAASIHSSLKNAATPAAKSQGERYFKGPVELLGVRAADIHRIAREAHASVKGHWSLDQAIVLANLLFQDPHSETRILACIFLGRFKRSYEPAILITIEDWIKLDRCDSWAIVDTLCIHVLTPLLTAHPRLLDGTRNWLNSSNQWLRRAALVSLTTPAGRGQLLDQSYDFASQVLADPEDLVQKAAGWLLRDAGKTDAARLQAFLSEHGAQMARTSLRYAIEKFTPAERQRILQETRKPK